MSWQARDGRARSNRAMTLGGRGNNREHERCGVVIEKGQKMHGTDGLICVLCRRCRRRRQLTRCRRRRLLTRCRRRRQLTRCRRRQLCEVGTNTYDQYTHAHPHTHMHIIYMYIYVCAYMHVATSMSTSTYTQQKVDFVEREQDRVQCEKSETSKTVQQERTPSG